MRYRDNDSGADMDLVVMDLDRGNFPGMVQYPDTSVSAEHKHAFMAGHEGDKVVEYMENGAPVVKLYTPHEFDRRFTMVEVPAE